MPISRAVSATVDKMLSALRRIHRRLRFRRLHRPEVAHAYRLLGTDYGGWPVIPALLPQRPLVYSFGVGEDVSFDRAVIEAYGAEVHAFDPTPRSREWIEAQDLPARFHFHPLGIGPSDGTAAFYPPVEKGHVSFSNAPGAGQSGAPVHAPVRRLATIMADLSHDRLDILKMDIEGFEYEVIGDLLETGIRPRLILAEFHHGMYQASAADTDAAAAALKSAGYGIFYVSDSGREYGFVLNEAPAPDGRHIA